jgi:hypothetical protein
MIETEFEIVYTYHIRTEAGLILPLEQFAPVDIGKEVVRLDLCGTVGTKTTLGIAIKQARQEIPSSGGNNVAARESQGLLQNLAVHFVGVLIVERRQTGQHFVEQDTESPPVHGLGVSIAKKQLGGKVLRSTTEG